jgi:hypothetical protein
VRFLRQLAAAALIVAVVVAGGLAWGHVDGGSLPRGPRGALVFVRGQVAVRATGGKIPPRGLRVINTGPMNLGLNSMFQTVNLPVLRDTMEIEAGVIAAVVVLEIGHRRWRRARRAHRL